MVDTISFDSLEYYKILGVSSDCSDEDIRQKYRELAKFWHPDHNESPNAVDMFQKISAAYETLKNPIIRLKYTLLSIIYTSENFPDMNALSVLKNMHGQEDINLRAFPLTEITGKGLGNNKIASIYYCSQYEAAHTIQKITRHNWLYGFWGLSAFFLNIKAIVANIAHINSKEANLNLILHNALAYDLNNKKQEALTLAILAQSYASKQALPFIRQYIDTFVDVQPLPVKPWQFKKLKTLQLFYPLAVLLIIGAVLGGLYLRNIERERQQSVNLKQVVHFSNGRKSFSDVSVASFFDVPVDVTDTSRLYHFIKQTKTMHGADDSFDVYKVVDEGTTVRLTGYTADYKWFRVMFDNGEMAFAKASALKQGIGNEIPLLSKIYKED